MIRGVRARLVLTIVGLVALTSVVLGSGAYAFVALSLHDRQVQEAIGQANFNIAVLAGERLPGAPTVAELEASGLADAFRLRGGAETYAELVDGEYFSTLSLREAPAGLTDELRTLVAAGRIGYERLDLAGQPSLVVGGRRQPDGPTFYFFFSSLAIEQALARMAQALIVGSLLLVALAALVSGFVARRLLRPVRIAADAAELVAAGDLSVRVPAGTPDEFGDWSAAFNRMAAALEQKVAELEAARTREERFVADVAHELRTPLTALVNEAALLETYLPQLGPDGGRLAELLVADVRRMRTLVEELMEISRLEAAPAAVSPESLDVSLFLAAVLAGRLPAAELVIPDPALRVWTDRRSLERIVGNLVDNAREHAGGNGVVVRAEGFGDVVAISVADRGPGLPPDAGRVFEPFFKADASRHTGGSGLGLAIAREHARVLGASLEARPREGGGAVFTVRVPVAGSLPAGNDTVIPGAEDEAR